MQTFILKRGLYSLVSLAGLLVAVFFLSRLTGDPAALYLPVDAPLSAREAFREAHGFNDPLVMQFGRYVWDVLHFDFGNSIRRSRPALEVVLEAFPWTLALAGITMGLVLLGAIVLGSLAALHVGGVFDRLSSIISLAAASAPDFWLAVDGDLRLRRRPRLGADLGHRQRGALDPAGGDPLLPPLRADPAGGARLDDHGARLALREDRPRQGGPRARRSSSCTRSGTPCCRSSPSPATRRRGC